VALKRQDAINAITEGISWLVSQCKLRGTIHLFDANTVAHAFYCRLLNEVYDLDLVVMDRIQANFPAIDLGDEVNKRSFQVTAEKKGDKIQATLDAYAKHNHSPRFGKLQVIVIGERQTKYDSLKVPPTMSFAWEDDIIDAATLLKHIDRLDTSKVLRIAAIIEGEIKSPPSGIVTQGQQPTSPHAGWRIRTHDSTEVTVTSSDCKWGGPAVKPSWLESAPDRMSDSWLAAKLIRGDEMHLYHAEHWCGGTWLVVDRQAQEGTVINPDQLADLRPASATTTTPAPTSADLEQSVSAVKLTHHLLNPLHRIIDLLTKYHSAMWQVHHANTQETRLTSLDEWRSYHPAVWGKRSVRDDTIRNLADPAKEWLSRINCRYVHAEDFNLIEEGAYVLSGFAVSPFPMSMPDVYSKTHSTEAELWQQWNQQGDQYMALGGLIVRLKELAARTGQMWNPSQAK